MQIPVEHAFWILDFYQRNGTPLQFGGKILGEEGACFAEVTEVWPEAQTVNIRLFEDDGEVSWDRLISLGGAIFVFDQLGAPLFVQYAEAPWHSVLHVGFPDGTNMFFAECVV